MKLYTPRMLLYFSALLLIISNVYSASLRKEERRRLKKHRIHHLLKQAINGTNVTIITTVNPLDNITTIPFSNNTANNSNSQVNALGEIPDDVEGSLVLSSFPYKLTRCDQIVQLDVAYLNDLNDFRIRNKGFMSITVHYVNLFTDKDGQKLIQQTLQSDIKGGVRPIKGAMGCLQVGGDGKQNPIPFCVDTEDQAKNILGVFKDFGRCRLGDNLSPVPKETLKKLVEECKVDMSELKEDTKVPFDEAVKMNILYGEHSKKKSKNPPPPKQKKPAINLVFPTETDNKWELDRKKYWLPGKLKVPGDKIVAEIPGLNLLNK